MSSWGSSPVSGRGSVCPSRRGWCRSRGLDLTEVALARVEESIAREVGPSYRLVVEWEMERRIEALFRRVSIDELDQADRLLERPR
jgi:hypothetical protein